MDRLILNSSEKSRAIGVDNIYAALQRQSSELCLRRKWLYHERFSSDNESPFPLFL